VLCCIVLYFIVLYCMMTVEILTVPIWNYSFPWSTCKTCNHEWHFEIM